MEALASPRAVIRHSYHDAGRSESFVRPNRPPMSAGHVVIGLISAPGAATEVPSNLADDLRAELSVRLPTVQWRIPTVVYVLVHPPADDAALVGAARERRENIGHAVRAGDYLKLVLLASALATPGGVERTEVRSWPEDADPGDPGRSASSRGWLRECPYDSPGWVAAVDQASCSAVAFEQAGDAPLQCPVDGAAGSITAQVQQPYGVVGKDAVLAAAVGDDLAVGG